MFSFLKTFFTTDLGPTAETTEETNVFNISDLGGKFAIVDRNGNIFGTYTRRRDAVRGAARRGLSLAA